MGHAKDESALANSDDFASLLEEFDALRAEVKSLRVLLVLQADRLHQLRGAVAIAQLAESRAQALRLIPRKLDSTDIDVLDPAGVNGCSFPLAATHRP